MLFWLVATSVLTIAFVFNDPAFDYRLLIVGATIPAIVDWLAGGLAPAQSLPVGVVLLVVLMLVTPTRSAIRRSLLGLPLGYLLYLVFGGAWTSAESFWWPVFGWSLDAPNLLADRGWWNVGLEAIGLAGCIWIWRRAGLTDRAARQRFQRTGQLSLR